MMGLLNKEEDKRIGLILSGGGARAAYQIGVLRGIATILPKDTPNPFHIISGTSAGALNAVSLATHAQRLRTGVRTLEYVWKNLSSDQIYMAQSANLLVSMSGLLLPMISGKASERPAALFDNAPLQALLKRVIKVSRIQKNIDRGLLEAVSITASSYSTGESVSFFQATPGVADWKGPHRIGQRTDLTLNHLLASSAIPVVFPAVRVDNQYFGDGAIRQLAPTSTPLHLGARRLLAIGVSATGSVAIPQQTDEDLEDLNHPNLSQILGHILNSAFVDTLENDLEFLQHVNAIIPHVPERVLKRNGVNMSKVDLLTISPSEDLNAIALRHYDELPKPLTRYFKEEGSGTLLSLILFEKGFCTSLWKLGFKDALAMEDEIRDFFALSA